MGKYLLGLEVRRRRLSATLSLSELADRSGLSLSYISDVERGRHLPTLEALDRLGTGLGTRPHNLLRGVYPWDAIDPPVDLPPNPDLRRR